MVMGSIPTLGMVRFLTSGNFFYPNLPQYTQQQMSTNIVGRVLSRRVGASGFYVACSRETKFHHWLLLAWGEDSTYLVKFGRYTPLMYRQLSSIIHQSLSYVSIFILSSHLICVLPRFLQPPCFFVSTLR